MFHRIFSCILLASILAVVSPVLRAQDCPDTQPFITGADIVCDQNAALNYTYLTPPTTGTPTHSYQWTVTPAAGRTITSATNQNQLQVQWQTPGSYTVQVTEWNNDPTFAGCIGKVTTKTITVQPLLHAYFYYQFDPAGGCFYNIVNFTGDVSVHADPVITYTWDFGDGSPVVPGPGVLQHTFPTTSGVTYTVTLTVTNSAGHTDQIIDYVYVNPDQYKPLATYANSATPVPNNCLYNPMNFDGSASLPKPATNPENITILYYEWDFDDPGSGTQNIVNSGTNPIVNHIFANFGLHRVKLTVTNSKYCTNTYEKDIFIDNTIPTASFTNTLACLGEATIFTTTSVTPIGTISQLEWIFGDGTSYTSTNPAEAISHTYLQLGTYSAQLRITNSNNCISDYFSKPVSVNPSPMASFLVGNACLGEAVAFTNTSTLNGGSQISGYLWNFADPSSGSNSSTDPNPTHLFSAVGNYNVSLQVTNTDGCANTHVISPPLVVSPKPSVDFTFQNGSQNWEILFHNITPAVVGNNLVWDFGDGTYGYGPDPSHVYQGPGNFLVTLTATDAINGCSNSIQQQVSMTGNASAFFTTDSPKCIGDTMHFTPQIPGGNIVKEVWNFGDGTIVTYNPPEIFPVFASHVYTSAQTWTVTRTVTYITNFFESFSIQVVVYPQPTANFTFSNNQTFPNTYACANQPVYFTDLSFSTSGNIIEWIWDFGDPGSGSSNNTSVLQNPQHTFSGVNQKYAVSLTVTDNINYCKHTYTDSILVHPVVPVEFTFTNNTCLNQLVLFTADQSVMVPGTIATWDWDFGDGSGHSGNPLNASHLYTTAGTYTAVLFVTDVNGCSNSVSKTVTVMPRPVPGFIFASPTCDSVAVQFTDQSYVPAGFPGFITQWVWHWGDGSTTTVNQPASPNVSHVFPGGIYNFSVKLVVTSSFGCKDSITHPVNVIPAPTAAFEVVAGTPACATQVVQFNDLSQTNGGGSIVGWLWNFADPGSGSNNTSTAPSPSHVFASGGTYLVSLIVTNANGCSHSIQLPVLIHLLPSANFTADTACAGATTTFTNTSVSLNSVITSYNWSFGDGGTSTLQSPLHSYAAFGIYNVTLTIVNTNGCIHTITKPVMVAPKPVPAFTFSPASCIGNPVTFTNLSFIPSGFSGYIKTWIWNFDDGSAPLIINHPNSPNVTYTFLGTSTSHNVKLTVITTANCSDSLVKTVNSIPSPISNFTYSNTTCLGQTVQFTDLSQTNGGGSLQNWNWDFGDPLSGANNISTLQNPTHSFTSAIKFPVTLVITSTNGCTHTFLDTITINPLPTANFTNTEACEGSPTTFTDASTTPGATTLISFSWLFGDGGTSTSQSPQHTYTGYGTYVVTLTITNSNGCIQTFSKPVIVNPKPIADFSFSPASCVGNPVNFYNHSFVPTGFSSSIQSWEWNFNDGTTPVVIPFPNSPDISHIFQGIATSHVVRLTVTTTTGCVNFVEKTVTSVPAPIANFSFSSTLCANQPVQFSDLSQTNGGGSIQTWLWNFGDPASGMSNTASVQNPVHQFTSAALSPYTVRLIVTNGNGCKDTLITNVNINARPVADFSTDTVCQGSLTTFTDISTPIAGTISSRLWEFGDGQTSTSANPTHLYLNSGNFNVKLTVTNSLGCQKDTTKPILVLGKPVVSFSYSSPNCAGDSVQFNDLSSTPHGSIQQWVWNFGDGSTPVTVVFPENQNVKHKFVNGGNFVVTLTITTSDGCEAEKQNTVQIGFHPLANFSFPANSCALTTPVQFTDLSQVNGGPAITTWDWDFGDPASGVNNTSTTQNPFHVFTQGGTFSVHLIVTNANGCIDSVANGKTITVNDAPLAAFSFDTACMASPTMFTDESTTAAGTLITWNWNFGDPGSGTNNTSTVQNPIHIFNTQGTFDVILQVTNSNQCLKDTMIQVTVSPKPIAMFQYSAACVGSETDFTDMSTAPGSSIQNWTWDFGDGTAVSTLQNPIHIFATAGTYQVKLTVKNLANCIDSVVIPVISRPTPVGQYTYTSYFCPAGKVDFQDLSTATASTIADRLWTFEPGYTSNIPNPSHTFPVTNMNYAVSLIVTDTYGCKDTIVDSVMVKPGFVFTFSNDTVCNGYSMHFQPKNNTPGDSLYSVTWNFGDPTSGPNNTSQLYRPMHTFTSPGVYVVKMKAYNSDNCVDSVFREVRVYAPPQPLFTFVSTPCDSTIQFTDSTQIIGDGTIASWKWIWGDGTASTVINAPGPGDTSHLYVNAGIYQVTLVMTSTHGCTDSITQSVQRFPCIKAGFTYADTLCARYRIAFSDSSLPVSRINQWKWSWGDGTPDTVYATHNTPIYHTFAASGVFNVNLEIQAMVNGSNIIDNMSSTVTVHPTPLTYFANEAVCLNQVTLFRDTSKIYGEGITKWSWTFSNSLSDTSGLKNPPHVYDTAGIYSVQLVVNNRFGCKDSLTKPTRVYGLPEAHYENTVACTGDPTFFTDISEQGDTTLAHWRWFFGDPLSVKDTSNMMDPSYIYPSTGDFTIQMIVKDHYGCMDTVDSTVRVNITPVSSFTLLDDYNGKQGQVKLNNFSTGANSYEWDFNNGETSTDENPVAIFNNDGTYTIKLISLNEFKCSDTTLYEYKLLFKGLYVPNAFAPTSTNLGIRLFQPVGANLKQGNYHVMVFDIWGHMVWESTKLDDKGVPTEGWDGTFEGNLMPQGNYMWKINAMFVDDSPWNGSDTGVSGSGKTMGNVSLIR